MDFDETKKGIVTLLASATVFRKHLDEAIGTEGYEANLANMKFDECLLWAVARMVKSLDVFDIFAERQKKENENKDVDP